MWRATVGYDVNQTKNGNADDDWETDPDFVNDVTEEEQRWGSKTVEGSGRTSAAINIQELRSNVEKDDAELKKKDRESGPKSSYGYGGKFGVQADRMDKSAVGHDYIAQVEKHASQTDAVRGFGGKFGVQADRQDKSAVGWDHHEKAAKHASQKDYSSGFGGKYGVQKDRVDKTAVGWDHVEKTEKHESQKDYAKGFGGKFGVDKGRQDKSAVGWEYQEKTAKHASQKDYAKGFGGRYGVQEDRQDKSALGWDAVTKVEAHPSQTDMRQRFGGKFGIEKDNSTHSKTEIEQSKSSYEKPRTESVGSVKASSLRARFESMAKGDDEEIRKRAAEERARRTERELKEWEVAKKDEEERQRKLSLREDRDDIEEEEPREHVPATSVRSSSVAVPTPLLQAATVKSASPEQSLFSAPAQPPPEFKDDHKVEEKKKIPAPAEEQTFLQHFIDSSKEDELFRPPQQYSEPDTFMKLNASSYLLPEEIAYETLEQVQEELGDESLEGSGVCAIALYDYQAADLDEISFDPLDVITNIEMIDEGWWRGECRGQVGLFPSNYVKLLNQ